MKMELIEKKNKPTKTKVQFTKKEWENMHKLVRLMYEKTSEKICTTARTIYFIMEGDLINRK